MDAPKIYAAIAAIMAEGVWVGKNKQASGGGPAYAFRSVDDVVRVLQPFMAKHGVTVTQRVIEREREAYQSKSGSSMVSVRLLVEHQFSASDGSFVIATTLGEANDTSDKASNKAMTAAFKYALVHTFMIPISEPDDLEESHHEPPPPKKPEPATRGHAVGKP